jgi:nitrogenase molybdenum-iron protein alpha/beta subunit
MTLSPLPTNSSRFGGCTLTGALSVTTHVRDTVSIIHGPRGCSHHNFSLLHATAADNDRSSVPSLISTGLGEMEIVYGGEEALAQVIASEAGRDIRAIFVLSTCIIDTIGDDVAEVCSREYGLPVIPVPSAGFLGGTFHNGVNNALMALAAMAEPGPKNTGVNIIGEMNLEYEVEENYAEISRLLSLMGITVNCRFVHELPFEGIRSLGAAKLNILRHPALVPVGTFLEERFGIPFVSSFPLGFSETLSFIRTVAETCGINGDAAVNRERCLQEKIIDDFCDLKGSVATFNPSAGDPEHIRAAGEAAHVLHMAIGTGGTGTLLPANPATGTAGMRRMLHRWRRSLHA